MMVDVSRVLEEHHALDTQAAELERDLPGGRSISHRIFEQIAAYASLLSEHLLSEHPILDEALGRGTPVHGATTTFSSDLEALRWDWEEYLSVWTEESASKDWAIFSEHSLALLARIRRRIGRENELLLGVYSHNEIEGRTGAITG